MACISSKDLLYKLRFISARFVHSSVVCEEFSNYILICESVRSLMSHGLLVIVKSIVFSIC